MDCHLPSPKVGDQTEMDMEELNPVAGALSPRHKLDCPGRWLLRALGRGCDMRQPSALPVR